MTIRWSWHERLSQVRPRGPSPPCWRPKPREPRVGEPRPPSEPGTRPAPPAQASAPNTAPAAGPGAPRTDARARPISERLRSEGRRRGQSARRWRGKGGSSGSSREAEPQASRSGQARPCGGVRGSTGARPRAEAGTRLPAVVPSSAASRQPPCPLHALPLGDNETEE